MNESEQINTLLIKKMTNLEEIVKKLETDMIRIKLNYENKKRTISIIYGSIGTILGTIIGIIVDRLSK